MTRKFLLAFLLSATLVACVCGHKEIHEYPTNIDDFNIQLEQGKPGDMEGDKTADIHFDSEIANSLKPPRKRPSPKKVAALYEKEKDRLIGEVAQAGDDLLNKTTVVEVNKDYKVFNLAFWHRNVNKCCSRRQNYQCVSKKFPMPCFYSYYGLTGEWCCPIWPKVYIARCECCQCAILLSTCAHEGRCQRRYTMTSFLAVCYRRQWSFIRYIRRYLPSSCYCRIC